MKNKIDTKLEKIISKNTLAIICPKCNGGGYDYDRKENCSECDGDGLTEWRFGTAVEEIKHLILSEIKKVEPKKKTEGILGILGTTHRDGVLNEGFNQAISEYHKALEELLK